MSIYFVDSSGIVKRYVLETGSAWIRGICLSVPVGTIYIAAIAGVEAVAAITRRVRQGTTTSGEAASAISTLKYQLVSDYTSVEFNAALQRTAMDLAEKHALCGYDAVQLASALQIQTERQVYGLSPPIFLSADNNLNAAAAAEGLAVDSPNSHS